MKSQVVEGHQKVLSAKPKNDELHLHPAAASEGGVGKQNVVWWLLGCVLEGAGWFAGVCVWEQGSFSSTFSPAFIIYGPFDDGHSDW